MKDPAILFYTSDFIAGTLTMTDAQRGKYIILLCLQHQKGYLTEKDMLNICKTHDEDIWIKFKEENGKFYNERMMLETEKRNRYSESRRNNRKSNICKSYDKHMGNININVNEIVIDLYKGVEIFFDEDCRPKTEKAKKDWYDTLDKLIRIDGYSPEHITNIIKRTRMDDFWRANFLSILKLRKKNKEGISYFTVFEKKLYNGATKTIGADVNELAALTASKLHIQQ